MTLTVTPIQRPTLQPTVVAVPLPGSRLAIHRGTRQADPSVVLEDPGSWRIALVPLLTGSNTRDDLCRALAQQGHSVAPADVDEFVDALVALSAVKDASYFDPGTLGGDQADRYSRNLNGFAALSTSGETPADLQRRLFNSRVLMLGCGGLGSCTATALVMAGCGALTLVDFDHVELGNLNRQLFTVQEIGQRKVEALRSRLLAVNPAIHVNAVYQRLASSNDVRRLIEQFRPHIVVAAIDRPVIAADRWISQACVATGVPGVFNSVSAGMGLVWSKVPGLTGCFQCDDLWSAEARSDHHHTRRYREEHDLIPATSAFSYSAMTVGGVMAADIIRHLVGWPMATAGKLVVIDFATLETSVTEKPQHPQCPACRR